MKEHFQDSGVRKWAGDDLVELQSESLDALQGLVDPYAPCVIKGCEVTTVPGADGGEPTYTVSAGLVALRGVDAAGNGCVKIVRAAGFTSEVMPVFLSLAYEQTTRAYGDGSSKVIANNYIAERSAVASEGALKLTAAGGERLVDTLGVTRKLDWDGGEAKDTVVGFTAAATRTELTTGSKLGILFGLVKRWLSDLRALAFKDKVAKGDLTDELAGELDSKVVKVAGKGLSDNNFTQALLDKLNGIADGANKYIHPSHTAKASGLYKITVDASGHVSAVTPVTKSDITALNIPAQDTTYGAATTSAAGLMSAADKTKLNGVATGANKYVHPSYTTKASGLYKITVDASGHVSAVTPVTKADITALGIPGQDTDTTYDAATTSAAGLMSAADKTKLNDLPSAAKIVARGRVLDNGNASTVSGENSGDWSVSKGEEIGEFIVTLNNLAGFRSSNIIPIVYQLGSFYTVQLNPAAFSYVYQGGKLHVMSKTPGGTHSCGFRFWIIGIAD